MNILVTGGAGFIGSHVVDLLLQEGNQVFVLDDFSTGNPDNLPKKIPLLICDISETYAVEKAFRNIPVKIDTVMHLAAQAAITTAMANPWKDLKTNGLGTLNMLIESRMNGVKKFIYTSTSAVYEGCPHPLMEICPTHPNNYYGISKYTGEMYVGLSDLDTTILRLGNVYGPRQVPIGENQVIPRMIRHLMFGDEFEIFGDGTQRRDFIFVEDVARAFLAAIDGDPGTYNIASGESNSVNMVAELLDISHDWKYNSSRQDARTNVQMDITQATECLDWHPDTDFATDLRKTMDWWQTCKK